MDKFEPTIRSFLQMGERFKERAAAIRKSGMPPLEGVARRKYVKQKEDDYRDYLMMADCDITFENGVLQMTLDLRPAICDAVMRNSPQGITDKSSEKETQVAMENIAKALPTDGNKITPGMLDSKADLQALIDGTEMFKVIDTPKIIKKRIGLSGYNPTFDYGGEAG
jgi:hypothetical protein